jgi:hypothetical protein
MPSKKASEGASFLEPGGNGALNRNSTGTLDINPSTLYRNLQKAV